MDIRNPGLTYLGNIIADCPIKAAATVGQWQYGTGSYIYGFKDSANKIARVQGYLYFEAGDIGGGTNSLTGFSLPAYMSPISQLTKPVGFAEFLMPNQYTGLPVIAYSGGWYIALVVANASGSYVSPASVITSGSIPEAWGGAETITFDLSWSLR